MATFKQIVIEDLNEGLVFFKKSKKLKKLLERLEKKVEMADIKSEVMNIKIPKKDIDEVFGMLKDIAESFEDVEKRFKEAKSDGEKKKAIREEYKNIKTKYKKVLDRINNEKTLRILSTIGILGGILAAASAGLTILMTLENIVGIGATFLLPRVLTMVGIPYIAGMGIGLGLSFLVRNIKNIKDKALVQTIMEIKQKVKQIKMGNIGNR